MGTADELQGMSQRAILLDAPIEVCPKCGGIYFREVVVFKKISKLKVGAPEDIHYPLPIHICDKCGELAPPYREDKKFQELLGLKNEGIEEVTIIK